MDIKVGMKVRHRVARDLGIGRAVALETAGGDSVYVKWANGKTIEFPPDDLEIVGRPSENLRAANVGPECLNPFKLHLLGRWFETRNAVTGELTNQAFEMLPHQVLVTKRVIDGTWNGTRRWLVADDVGLGKTIEAGMIMEVLRKQKGGHFRCLVVTPAGLCRQWDEEMRRRFGRAAQFFQAGQPNILQSSLVIASIDTIKAKYDPTFKLGPRWDLVIFDEAHHLATDKSILKYKFAHRLLHEDKKADNVLFLTATPHSGNHEHFANMLSLLREDIFRSKDDVTKGDGRLNQVMIRNRKTDVTDAKGQRIFRGIAPAKIILVKPTSDEVAFQEALLKYVREGYKVADVGKENRAIGFLVVTFKKLASSSLRAIHDALTRRLDALGGEFSEDADGETSADERHEGETDEAKAVVAVLKKGKKGSPIKNETDQLRGLLKLLKPIKARDSKVSHLLKELKSLPPDVKVLVFTEYRGTQRVLVEQLSHDFGEGSVCEIQGSMGLDERRAVVGRFNTEPKNPRFMVSTEAGGEGLNMQESCHVVVNYDLPWNPIRLQQRIGRVYRYGQKHQVQVFNFRLDHDSDAFVDSRIEDLLRLKIEQITKQIAVVQDNNPEDIQNEVLGTVVGTFSIPELYEKALREGGKAAEEKFKKDTQLVDKILADPKGMLGLFKGLKRFILKDYHRIEARVAEDQLDFFVKQYVTHRKSKVTTNQEKLWGFKVPEELRKVAERISHEDKDECLEPLGKSVERATVSKEVAQTRPGARLLRFGDMAFDAMVRDVQASDFSDGVASIKLGADLLGWRPRARGVCAIFDLKVLRTQEGETAVVRDEMVAFLVPVGGTPLKVDAFFDKIHQASQGSRDVDVAEVKRAGDLSARSAEDLLRCLRDEVVTEFGAASGIVSQMDEYAMAWVEAVS